MLQVRLELTTSASPAHILLYKYRALTDCATGACFPRSAGARSTEPRARARPSPRRPRQRAVPQGRLPHLPPAYAAASLPSERAAVWTPPSLRGEGSASSPELLGTQDAPFTRTEQRRRRTGARTPALPRLPCKKGTTSVEDASRLAEARPPGAQPAVRGCSQQTRDPEEPSPPAPAARVPGRHPGRVRAPAGCVSPSPQPPGPA